MGSIEHDQAYKLAQASLKNFKFVTQLNKEQKLRKKFHASQEELDAFLRPEEVRRWVETSGLCIKVFIHLSAKAIQQTISMF